MRKFIAPAMLLTVVLAACARDSASLTSPDARVQGDAVLASQLSVQRPIAGHCEVTFTVLPSTPPLVRQADSGTCQVSQLGATTTVGAQTINFATLTQTATRTFTAANGDELRATSTGTSRPGAGPGEIDFDAMLTIVGGTGRFTNATGQVHDWGTANVVTHAVSFSLDGWIAYDASDGSAQ